MVSLSGCRLSTCTGAKGAGRVDSTGQIDLVFEFHGIVLMCLFRGKKSDEEFEDENRIVGKFKVSYTKMCC